MDYDSGPESPSVMADEPLFERRPRQKRPLEDPHPSYQNGQRNVRVKTEPGLNLPADFDDEYEPPTPPVPRANQEEENGPPQPPLVKSEPLDRENGEALPFISVSTSVFENNDSSESNGEPPAPNQEQVRVKAEPGLEDKKEAKPGPSRERPTVSDFLSFTSRPQAEVIVPNVVHAPINVVPVARAGQASYYQVDPKDEFSYAGATDNKPSRIPMSKGADTTDDSSEGENEENDARIMRASKRYTGYLKSNTVYEKFDFKSRRVDSTRLAVHEKKAQILNSLEKARVVIIEGFTGCGKTTQVPQYILDSCYDGKRICNIVVTQPRKIAAMSVAKRVCYERSWEVGTVVGYQVGMDSSTDRKDTLLTFMTTGVLLQKLISLKSLKEFTHIIIDEVHERDLESDFLLLIIKRIMGADKDGKEKHVKLILMSATIETRKFEDYFIFDKDGEEIRPHVVKIPFVKRHTVEEFYLDHLLRSKMDQLNVLESNMEKENAVIQDEIYDICVSCLKGLDDDEREDNPDPRMRNKKGYMPKHRGAVLIFLPGMEEIKRLQRALEKAKQEKIEDEENVKRDPNFYKWVILPLHSSVTAEDQAQVFEPQGETFRKIILSTNIAESSVTVPDISYVIDFCLTKSMSVDKHTNFTTLRMLWAAKSQCIQRKGRAGRVADGKVFRLVPQKFYETLDSNIEPEMLRSNLETVVLQCKKLALDSPANLLKDSLDRPKHSGIQRAVSTLKELGALTIEMVDVKDRNKLCYEIDDGDLTNVGEIMAALPISQQCTRLILLGHCFGVMQEALIIAAGLSVKSPFQSGFQKQLDTYLEKMKHAKKSFSDLFALYHVYKDWVKRFTESGEHASRRSMSEHRWAKGAMVHLPVLKEIKSTVELLEERLKRKGITDSYTLPVDPNSDGTTLSAEQGMFLKLAIAGAFYPQYFLRRRPDLKQYQKEINKEVHGHDPFRTVYFKGFPPGHKGELYAKHVADYLSHGQSVPAVKFDGQKVLAVFDNSTSESIGPINVGVFRAIKLRQLRVETLEFRLLWKEEENSALNQWRYLVQRRQCIPCPPLRNLPPVNVFNVEVKVVHIISPSQFWVNIQQDFTKVEAITEFIWKNLQQIPLPRQKLCPNVLCLAPFDGQYYRAKILRTDMPHQYNARSLVYFVDYGNSAWVSSSTLYDFSPFLIERHITTEPCMAIECRLKELKPRTAHGLHWSPESVILMKEFCDRAPILKYEIYSIYQSTIVGELVGYGPDGMTGRLSLHQQLLHGVNGRGAYGETTPEPYLSMENNRKRQRAKLMPLEQDELEAAAQEQIGDPVDLDFIDPPRNGRVPVTLKGPWSPLEMTYQACIKCSCTKEVRIETSSVNSVSLDHEPTLSNSRMLVGSFVNVTKSDACMVRDSTVMSAIPGILSLVSMIFSPKAELRVDRDYSKYTGVLCGCGTILGKRKEMLAVHPDNDMEVVFDTEIDDRDIDQINTIRFYLNLILKSNYGVNKSEYHAALRKEVILLLQRDRKKIIEEVWPQEEHVWDRIDPTFLCATIGHGMSFNHDDIFQPHRKVLLNKVAESHVSWNGDY